MSQLRALLWLKWRLFRNSLRSSRGAVNQLATGLALFAALLFAAVIASGLGFAAYFLSSHEGIVIEQARAATGGIEGDASVEFIYFLILAFCYLIWATLPLSIGSSKQFEPGRLLMYPVSLRKLFALDLTSELTNLQSIFAIPAILAIGIGAGIARDRLGSALFIAFLAICFGVAFSKWLSVSMGLLIKSKRSRGETVIALIGVVFGLGAAFIGQLAPYVLDHVESFRALRVTPPGAIAFALTEGLEFPGAYLFATTLLAAYTTVLVVATYLLARRSFLGRGRSKNKKGTAKEPVETEVSTGWNLRFLPPDLSAILEKELRYIMRNAQLRMMALMPLLLIFIRLINRKHLRDPESLPGPAGSFVSEFLIYGQGIMATGGVVYVFLILTGLSCNQFAFEEGGMRTLILSPVDRRKILIAKNIAMVIVALLLSAILLLINHAVFRDLNMGVLLFTGLSFVTFAAIVSILGNWLSMQFPKRMKFGKHINVSGVVGLLLIPMVLVMALPPTVAMAAGYLTRSFAIQYATLTGFAGLAVCAYLLIINAQGRMLQRREVEILEVVREPTDD